MVAESNINTSQPELIQVAVDHLVPNDYNPNRMTSDEFQELVAEVRRLRRLPKPIVARWVGDQRVIVDGEHGWRAATEVGLKEISVEMVAIDDFEAMRQTYTRNQHGTHDPVREGRMFLHMMDTKRLNQTELAEQIGVSEGKIRNSLLYVEAADRRNSYVLASKGEEIRNSYEEPDDRNSYDTGADASTSAADYASKPGDEDIAKLTVRNMRRYLDGLPKGIGDLWVDAGADNCMLKDFPSLDNYNLKAKLDPIVHAGLTDLIKPDFTEFRDSLRYAFALADWWWEHDGISLLVAHVRAVADLGLPPAVLEKLPCEEIATEVKLLLTAEQWTEILGNAKKHASSPKHSLAPCRNRGSHGLDEGRG